MEENRQVTISDLKERYRNVLYLADDGNYYKLSRYYPFRFGVKDRPDFVCLDTGGQMEVCDFGIFTVDEGKLMREEGGVLRQASSSLRISDD